MIKEQVILVDDKDMQIGTMEKMAAHQGAHLHRAISVFIFDTNGHWLLQQRALDKYHSKGKWSNTCCTHPAPGETNADAANRRLMQEMGMQVELTKTFVFRYYAELENELTEHEIDHVFMGFTNTLPIPNPEEVMAYRYISFTELQQEIEAQPDNFTAWFRKIFQEVNQHFSK
jgi:isopentenyl-diphosphate delta-isomerase